MKLLTTSILVLLLASCTTITKISYRQTKKSEYIKECGYIINCKNELNKLIITAFTPKTWDAFYYQYLNGISCDKSDLIIKSISASFPNTNDKLEFEKVDSKNQFYFNCENLEKVLSRNKEIKITLIYTDKEKDITITYILKRFKHKYITGGKPLGC